jgi:DNA-binding LacI/PurR family transcriptional regulator
LQAVYMGYQRALREKTSTLTPENLVLIDGWGIAAGKAGGRELLKRKKLPRAIFAATDTIAIGCMQVLQQAGVRFPEDAALVGFNDIPLAELVQPALTTVAAPAVEMGRKGMTMLQSLILGKLPARQHIILPVELIVRESCGALRD